MTSRERVLAAFAGEPVDRLPHFEAFVDGFPVKWRRERQVPPDIAIDDYYGNDITILAADETSFYAAAGTVEEGDGYRLRRDGWGRTLRERPGRFFYEVVDNVASTGEAILDLPWDDPAAEARYAGYDRQLERCASSGRAGFAKIGGPFLRTTFVRGETEYLMDLAADPELARALADKMADHLLAVALESLRRAGDQVIGMSMWDDIAHNGGPFFSTRTFERVFLPGYERIVRGCREAGAPHFFFHSDGDIRPILPYLADIGVDAINPVEPRAGMDVIALAEQYHGRLTFIGGADNSGVICFGTPDEVRAHTAPIARAARERGGIICGMHSVEGDVPVENYEAYLETVLAH